MIVKIALAFAAVAVVVLAYGYWHAETHATLYVSLRDSSEGSRHQPVLHAELSFVNSAGQVVARARPEAPHGTVYLSEPAQYSCREFEQSASMSAESRAEWKRCFRTQSRWLARLVPEITSVSIETGSCALEVPAAVSRRRDWWLWWVPLPHVGGTPYTSYSITIAIDAANCARLVA